MLGISSSSSEIMLSSSSVPLSSRVMDDNEQQQSDCTSFSQRRGISLRRKNYQSIWGNLNRPSTVQIVLCSVVVALLSQPYQLGVFVSASNNQNYYKNNYYGNGNYNYNYNNNNNANNNYNYNNNGNNYNYNNNYQANQYNYNDDANNNDDDGNKYNYNANNDDGNNDDDDYFNNDDAAAANDDDNDYYANDDDANGDDDGAYNNADADDGNDDVEAQYKNVDDDLFHWNSNVGFDGVSVMPISCINYNNGHMIKFQLFDSENSYQCHFSEISTFVVSIAHYMRSYFNYQALINGKDFELPGDAGYLNCIKLEETANSDQILYAKIGCMERETFTSTKLSLHLYTDAQCSQPYDDGQTNRKHATRGYEINGYVFPTRVSFRPPFYSCETCTPDEFSQTFNKKNSNWYDDDYISTYGSKNNNNGNYNKNYNNADDDDDDDDDAYAQDDAYMAANDDVANHDDAYNYNNNNDDGNNNGNDDANNYQFDDDYYNRKLADSSLVVYNTKLQVETKSSNLQSLSSSSNSVAVMAAPRQLKEYKKTFWKEYDEMKRQLYENNYDIGDWNLCKQIYKYGVWCDEDCRALDFFRTDQWSASDIFLLSIMCTFVTAMMLLVVAKRLKAQQKAKIYREEQPMPGLPPLGMALIFCFIMCVIVILAKLRFVNETLVFAVVTCILLFIYMLKLTLFETRRPVLLAAPRHHEMFDNPMDERLFD